MNRFLTMFNDVGNTPRNTGMQMHFSNGVVVSIMHGRGNLARASDPQIEKTREGKVVNQVQAAQDAEVYVFHRLGDIDWLPFQNGNAVIGHLTPEALVMLLTEVQALTQEEIQARLQK